MTPQVVLPHFILEGPDGSGKTTLANRLVKLGYVYRHFAAPTPDEDLFQTYLQATIVAGSSEEPIVFDRLAHGELVYGPLLRGKSKITLEQLRLLERHRRAVGAMTILCRPGDREKAAEAWWRLKAKRGELLENGEQYLKVWDAYSQFQFDTMYDIQLPGNEIISWASARTFRLPEGYAGSPHAKVLFVGEQIGNTLGDYVDLPFMATTGSSGYLNKAIAEAGFDEKEIALTNAYTAAGKPRPIIQADVVIALGAKAAEECLRQNITCRVVPHPQFWKRFHYHEFPEYVRLLREAGNA
jgi:hypothetical protein